MCILHFLYAFKFWIFVISNFMRAKIAVNNETPRKLFLSTNSQKYDTSSRQELLQMFLERMRCLVVVLTWGYRKIDWWLRYWLMNDHWSTLINWFNWALLCYNYIPPHNYSYTHYEIKGSTALFQYSRCNGILALFTWNWVRTRDLNWPKIWVLALDF